MRGRRGNPQGEMRGERSLRDSSPCFPIGLWTLLCFRCFEVHASRKRTEVVRFTDGKLPLHDSVAEWEQFRISQALKESNGNKAEAARRLGVHRRLLYEKIGKLDLDATDQILEDENLDSSKTP